MNSTSTALSRSGLSFLLLLSLLVGACSREPATGTAGDNTREIRQPQVAEISPDELTPTTSGARRVILVIGDGMGPEQIRAASLYKTGTEDGLVLQGLPIYSTVSTHSASDRITDSAAAGTAIATAIKVQNGAVGVQLPGDGRDLPLITEDLTGKGWRFGLVTTAYTTHATPAAFGAHVATRLDYPGIADDYLTRSRPHVIFGGGGYGMDVETVTEAGYRTATNRDELTAEINRSTPEDRIAGLFGDGHMPYLFDGRPTDMPGLVEMSRRAVEFLVSGEESGDDGFFLMIEGARIDHAGHANDIKRLIPEVLELDAVVEMLLNHPDLQDDTLLVVTADHETGGLRVINAPEAGEVPEAVWSTNGHTATDVPLYATGTGAEAFVEVIDNTLLHPAMLAALEPEDTVRRLAANATLPVGEGTVR
jgi:alkaline phosphatase